MKDNWKTILRSIAVIALFLAAIWLLLIWMMTPAYDNVSMKPVIYLYPEEEMDVAVQLWYDGEFTVLYPQGETEQKRNDKIKRNPIEFDPAKMNAATENGEIVTWHVTARPDGTLIDAADGREYSYLFWEGVSDHSGYNFSEGFCVAGEDTMAFLQEILPQIGLTPREYNEFIVYWLPQMQDNPYNVICFQQEAYTDRAQLQIDPQPDRILRVYMTWKASDSYVEMEPQTFETFMREGFTVVEWGGAEIH